MLGLKGSQTLKTKAAETGVLVPWALQFCRDHEASISFGPELRVAGESLVRYVELLKEQPLEVPANVCHELMGCCVRHLMMIGRAAVGYVPKHHLWVHLVKRIPWMGNPRFYATFYFGRSWWDTRLFD